MAELNSRVYDFKTFIDEYPLPQIVKVIEGVYGNEDELTLSALEVVHLHMVKNCDTVKATDERNREFYLPLNSPAKVKVLPNPIYQEFYDDVLKLAEDFPTYVEACDDDSELNIKMGDVLKLKRLTTNPHDDNYLICECTNKEKREILIPFSYRAKFKTHGDFEHSVLFLKEVVEKIPHFPVLVKFQDNLLKTSRRDINAGCPTGFNQLGAFSLKEAFVMKLVVATSCGTNHGSKERTLLTIPHDLDIRVIPVLDTSERSAYQTEKLCRIGSFKINFNETSFRYGCNFIKKQECSLLKQGNTRKPIPRSRNRVTPDMTATSSGICDDKQTVNDSCVFSSCLDDETEKKGTCADDIDESAKTTTLINEKEDVYVDMSFCKDITPEVNFGESESLKQQQSKNFEATAATSGTGTGTGTADDDDNDEEDGGERGRRRSRDSSGSDDGKDGHLAKSNIPPLQFNNSRDITEETNDYDEVPVKQSQSASRPTSIVKNLRYDTNDNVFQSGHGHLGLPPFVPKQPRPYLYKTDTEEGEEEEEQNQEKYVCMTKEVGAGNTIVHLEEGRNGKKPLRQLSDLGPSISSDSGSSATSFPLYDVPPSISQSTKKTKSKIRKKIENLKKISLKRSKSTTDMESSVDYHYVEPISEAKADKQTDIAKFLSRLQRSKKQGGKDFSPVDYLSTLTVDEVSESLKNLNLHRYVETFRANTVDGSLLMDLNDKMLDELEVTSEIDRLKIRKLQTQGWTPKYQ